MKYHEYGSLWLANLVGKKTTGEILNESWSENVETEMSDSDRVTTSQSVIVSGKSPDLGILRTLGSTAVSGSLNRW